MSYDELLGTIDKGQLGRSLGQIVTFYKGKQEGLRSVPRQKIMIFLIKHIECMKDTYSLTMSARYLAPLWRLRAAVGVMLPVVGRQRLRISVSI